MDNDNIIDLTKARTEAPTPSQKPKGPPTFDYVVSTESSDEQLHGYLTFNEVFVTVSEWDDDLQGLIPIKVFMTKDVKTITRA